MLAGHVHRASLVGAAVTEAAVVDIVVGDSVSAIVGMAVGVADGCCELIGTSRQARASQPRVEVGLGGGASQCVGNRSAKVCHVAALQA